jgi:hypothetical protein
MAYPNYYTTVRGNYVFVEASEAPIVILPLSIAHIDEEVVDDYAYRMISDPGYVPTAVLFGMIFMLLCFRSERYVYHLSHVIGTSANCCQVNWIVDGHHKMFAAARTGIIGYSCCL